MNMLELKEILDKLAKQSIFLGVFACDQLPKTIHEHPAMMVMNTERQALGCYIH